MDAETLRDEYAAQWQAESTLGRTDLDWVSWLVERLTDAEKALEFIEKLEMHHQQACIIRARAALARHPSKEGKCARCGFVGSGSEGFGTHRCKEATP